MGIALYCQKNSAVMLEIPSSDNSVIQKFVSVFGFWFFYTDTRQVTIRLRWYAVLIRAIVSITLACYIIGERMIIQQGYAEFVTDGQSSVFTKLSGFTRTNLSREELDNVSDQDFEKVSKIYNKFSDTNDEFHGARDESIFVATNLIITPEQTRTVCADIPNKNTECQKKDNTVGGMNKKCNKQDYSKPRRNGTTSTGIMVFDARISGKQTGKCVEFNKSHTSCQYYGWCPPNSREPPSSFAPVFKHSRNFEAQIQNKVYFPSLDIELSNNNPRAKCMFDPAKAEKTRYCRNWRVEDMVGRTGNSFDSVAMKGGVIRVQIDWTCFLGWWSWILPPTRKTLKRQCLPTYNFTLMEGVGHNMGGGGGWHKMNTYYTQQKTWKGEGYSRRLDRVIGIYFKIDTTYNLSKFDPVRIIVVLMAGKGFWKIFDFFFWLVFSGFRGQLTSCLGVPCCSMVERFNDRNEGWKTKKKVRVPKRDRLCTEQEDKVNTCHRNLRLKNSLCCPKLS